MRGPPQELAGYGQHIYAYCNVRTNQVLYSLRRNLKDSALKQLPDIGANNTPPKIRPDLWKPLYSVTLPSSEQGLRLFRKLKEWKKVHELCWKPPTYLSRSYTEKEIKEMQEKLDNRGGSKKETVYDLIKREKKKMRQKIIMNQKANSVADLAAVLIEQEREGVATAEQRKEALEKKLGKERELIVTLAEDFDQGGLKKIDDEIQMMRSMLAEEIEGQKQKLKVKVDQAKQDREKMVFASAAVREAKAWVGLSPQEKERQADHWQSVVESEEFAKPQPGKNIDLRTREVWSPGAFASTMHREYNQTWEQIAIACKAEGYAAPESELASESEPAEASSEKSPGVPGEQKETETTDYKDVLPCFPARLDLGQISPRWVPRRSGKGYKLNEQHAPSLSAEGVKVQWANFLDAEFADPWPEAVQHERMSGRKERLELLEQQRNEKSEAYQSELAEMVELTRKEMGLVEADVEEEVDEIFEAAEHDAGQEKTTEEIAAEEAAAKNKTPEEIAADEAAAEEARIAEEATKAAEEAARVATAEERAAREVAAQEAAVEAVKKVRLGRRLPPKLEGIQSEILARVQAKATQEGWRGAPQAEQAPKAPSAAP